MIGPLWRRAVLRLTGEGPWAVLVVAALVLLATAAAAGPMVRDAAGNAAALDVLRSVPAGAPADRAPVVRITDGEFRQDGRSRVEATLAEVPGMGEPTVTAQSWYADRLPFMVNVAQTVELGDLSARGRLYGVEDPESVLVPVVTDDAPDDATAADTLPAVHLGEPLARELGARVGDTVEFRLETGRDAGQGVLDPLRAAARVVGVFEVDEDARRPVDTAGSTFWADRLTTLPRDTQFRTLRADLVVMDPLAAQTLAAQMGDQLLWVTAAELDPPEPTLSDLRTTGAAVDDLALELIRPGSDNPEGALRVDVTSGLAVLAARAAATGEAGVAATVTPALGGVLLALTVVLALAVLGAARRRIERQVAVSMGVRPVTAGGLAVAELAVPAVVALIAGSALAWGVVVLVGPDGLVSRPAVIDGVTTGAAWLLVGLAVTGVVAAVAAWVAARPETGTARPPVPWVALLVVVAATTTAGLVLSDGEAEALDLAVPVLVTAATGAAGGWVVLTAWRRHGRRSAGRQVAGGRQMTARRGGSHATAPLSVGRALRALAMRRLTAPGSVRLVIVTLLTGALGLGAWVVTGQQAVGAAVLDKTATEAGAEVVVSLVGEELGVVYPDAPRAPEPLVDENGDPIFDARGRPAYPDVPPAPELPVAVGDSVAYRDQVDTPEIDERIPLIVVDPQTFDAAADWGAGGPAMRESREALALLGRLDDERGADLDGDSDDVAAPVIVAGAWGPLREGTTTVLTSAGYAIPVEIVATVAAFPGLADDNVAVVAGSDTLLRRFGPGDPRLVRPTNVDGFPSFEGLLHSSRPAEDVLRLVSPVDLTDRDFRTSAEVAGEPEFFAARLVAGYQLSLAALVAAVGLTALALFADRTAAAARSSSVALARTRLGRGGVVRALLVEQALLVGVAAVLAACAVAVMLPLAGQLLDPAPDRRPALVAAVEPVGVLALVVVALSAWVVAAVVTVTSSGARPDEEVLRDDD